LRDLVRAFVCSCVCARVRVCVYVCALCVDAGVYIRTHKYIHTDLYRSH